VSNGERRESTSAASVRTCCCSTAHDACAGRLIDRPPALIRKVCAAGTCAPSGGNRQPWFFIAVTDPERRRWVADRYRPTFHAYIQPVLEAAKDPSYPEAKRRNMRAAIHLADRLHEAPVHLFVAGWTRRGRPQLQALFPAVQNVLLACRAVGLGASLTTLHLAFGKEVDEWLGLPPGCPTCALLPIGWRAVLRRPGDGPWTRVSSRRYGPLASATRS
jgi:nitroreductase